MSTALQTTNGGGEMALTNPIAASLEAADQLGKWMASSQMFGCKTHEQAKILAMTCIIERITPIQFSQTYHMIDGKLSMRADAMLAKFVEAGGEFDVIERSVTRCCIKFTWRDKVTDFDYDIEEAKTAGLIKSGGGWTKMPKNMLFARCVTTFLRSYVPELFAGHYDEHEVKEDVFAPVPVAGEAKPLFKEPPLAPLAIKPDAAPAIDTPANTEREESEELRDGLDKAVDKLGENPPVVHDTHPPIKAAGFQFNNEYAKTIFKGMTRADTPANTESEERETPDFAAALVEGGIQVGEFCHYAIDKGWVDAEKAKGVPVMAILEMVSDAIKAKIMSDMDKFIDKFVDWLSEQSDERKAEIQGMKGPDAPPSEMEEPAAPPLADLMKEHDLKVDHVVAFLKSINWVGADAKKSWATINNLPDNIRERITAGIDGFVTQCGEFKPE